MIDYRAELRTLVETRLGLPVHGVHFIPRQYLAEGGASALERIGRHSDEQIQFEVRDSPHASGGVLRGMGGNAFLGMTICTQSSEGIEHHVFIQSDNPRSSLLTEEDRELDKSIQQIVALTHEFGHVRDMAENINFQFSPSPSVYLARAEAEAHAFTLEYLSSRELSTLRRELAKALTRLASATSPHERDMYAALCKRVGKGRLKRWASAA